MSEKTHVDPSALGLFGLAIVTLVASSQKLGITSGVAYVIPWAIFLGALAQLAAGILDYKKGNVFGATAFCAYGFFWLAMATSWLINLGAFGTILKENVNVNQMGFAFIGYLIITIFLTIGSLSTNKVLFYIFLFIDFLFIGLAISTLIPKGNVHLFFHNLAGISELIISLLSFYAGGANVLKNHFGKDVLPIGRPFISIN
ncbi:MAG: acetate uptake transporter [Spirochaetaceae bacterium]|nr:acetate uptake transporter [Spirochaetaceae bacterium]